MLISKRATDAFLDRKLDSFQWMKKLSRDELLREIRQFKVRPHFKTEPWLHQLVCFYIGCCMPQFMFLLDMGLGKTKIMLDLITQAVLERRLRNQKALVLVPRVINLGSWRDDVERHSDLEPVIVDVEDIDEKWERLRNPKGELTVIDYQSLQWALSKKVKVTKKRNVLVPDMERVDLARRLYGFVGIDESHKLANADSLWFDLVRMLSHSAGQSYGLTGTLFGKDPAELWPQFLLVDRGETFGEEIGLFRSGFFSQSTDNFKGTVWTYRRRMAPKLTRMLQHRSLRYDEREIDEIDVPHTVRRKIFVDMTQEQEGHYLDALEGIINKLVSADGRRVCWATLRRIGSGYLKWTDEIGGHRIIFKQNPKLDAMERFIDEAGSNKVIVCHEYTDTGELASARLTALGIKHEWLYGGSKDRHGIRERFMNDPDCRVLLMNSEAGGTGTDGLQKVCHYMMFLESPPNPKTRKQTEKRIARSGQRERSFIYDVVARGTGDKSILAAIEEGVDLFEEVVNGGRWQSSLFRS